MEFFNVNNSKMKNMNTRAVLSAIRENEPISRKELAELVGLTSSSITNIVGRLVDDGYIIEVGQGESQGGRRPVMLELNSRAKYAVGVELNVSDITCIIADFKAKKVIKKQCRTPIHEGKDKVIQELIHIINQAIEEACIPRERIVGIGLVSAGPYDYERGIMLTPPNFPGWVNVPIRDIVQEATGIPTYFEKDSVGAAMGEYWFGCRESEKSLFHITVNNIGIGAGFIADGSVYRGFYNGAGDIGHAIIDPDGPSCSCGNYGCLETLASGMAVLRNIKSEIKRGASSVLMSYVNNIDDIDIDMVVTALREQDELCKITVEKSARYLGMAISNIISILSPEVIVIGGKFADICPAYVISATEHARKRTYPFYSSYTKILPSTLGVEAEAMGGIAMVFQELLNMVEME